SPFWRRGFGCWYAGQPGQPSTALALACAVRAAQRLRSHCGLRHIHGSVYRRDGRRVKPDSSWTTKRVGGGGGRGREARAPPRRDGEREAAARGERDAEEGKLRRSGGAAFLASATPENSITGGAEEAEGGPKQLHPPQKHAAYVGRVAPTPVRRRDELTAVTSASSRSTSRDGSCVR
ncbi:hypothetical protein AOLI_G00315580, partial [Acnodon oligacanthus]